MRGLPIGVISGGLAGLAVAAVLLGAGFGLSWGVALAQHVHSHTHAQAAAPAWLMALKPEARMPAIQRQLRGFETTMAEVAYRYGELYFGATGGNWDYAAHMAMTLEQALRLGLEREPARRANGESLFLKTAWPPLLDAIGKKDPALFKERFETLRAACTSCHAAEQHAFIRIGLPTVKRNPVE
jgi:hypothetical protein